MTRGSSSEGEPLARPSHDARWPPLVAFPLSYALHVAEEAWGGETFPVWASRLSGAAFSRDEFVVLNGVAFAVMCVAVTVASRRPGAGRTVVPALGTIVTANGILHVAASVWTATYSPGVISGALVWLPLGAWTLGWAARTVPARQLWGGCLLGVIAHGTISAIAFLH